MTLRNYIKFYINDESHWYISKIKPYTEKSINEMAKGLSLFIDLLKQNPKQNLIKEYKAFIPKDNQAELFYRDTTIYQIPINKYSKLFLSLKIANLGLVEQDQLKQKNLGKSEKFKKIIDDFNNKKTYFFLSKKYDEKFLTDEIAVYYRNFESWFQKFGFMGRTQNNDYCFFTDIGLEFAKSKNSKTLTNAIFLTQIKKLQVWNPTIDEKYSDIKVIPYYVLLELFLKLNDNFFTKTEYILFITKIKNYQEIPAFINLIHEFRKLNKEEQKKYIIGIENSDARIFPKRQRTNFTRLKDSSSKEIAAYTFGGVSSIAERSQICKLVNKKLAQEELEEFNKKTKFIKFTKKEDWIRHLGSLNGLSLEEILELYVAQGQSVEEIMINLNTKDEKIKKSITNKLLEKEVEEYFEHNLSEIDPNLEIVEDPYGRQYSTPIGIIDMLCKHKITNEYYVLEFKRSQVSDDTVGQILRYMGWIYFSVESSKKTVRGIIIGTEFPEKLNYALLGIQSSHIFEILKLHKHNFTEKNKPIV